MNIFQSFKSGISSSSNYLKENINKIISGNNIEKEILENLEDILISADIGVNSSKELINKLKKKNFEKIDIKTLQNFLSSEIEKTLLPHEKNFFIDHKDSLGVIIFVGVNGSGKTTTIGKIAKKMSKNKRIMIAACDTFRAAAIEQLTKWAKDSDINIFQGKENQDPASVAFEAVKKARIENYDSLLVDTAGRLSNNTNLMNQLAKINSAIVKSNSSAKNRVILVLDGSTGSNLLNQFENFHNLIELDGLIITKLDGTAKGGALISIASKHKIPIYFIGMGEGIDDLIEFRAKEYSQSLFNLGN